MKTKEQRGRTWKTVFPIIWAVCSFEELRTLVSFQQLRLDTTPLCLPGMPTTGFPFSVVWPCLLLSHLCPRSVLKGLSFIVYCVRSSFDCDSSRLGSKDFRTVLLKETLGVSRRLPHGTPFPSPQRILWQVVNVTGSLSAHCPCGLLRD